MIPEFLQHRVRELVTGYWEILPDWRPIMGAIIALPLIAIVLITVGYVLWTLYEVALDTISLARSTRHHGLGETAAHYDPTDHQHVSTTPPKGYGPPR